MSTVRTRCGGLKSQHTSVILGCDEPSSVPELAGPLLETRDLQVRFYDREGCTHAVRGLSYSLDAGRSLAIIGESGAGKSVSCRAIMNLLSANATVSGSIRFNGMELLGLTENEIRSYRGAQIGMVFQDTEQALNPTMRIGPQISEAVRLHTEFDRGRTFELLSQLQVSAPEELVAAYPHELSGGMRQRVMIAIALAGNPKLLIADEPTRALDVMTQAEILALLKAVQSHFGMAIILVTHDLMLAANFADDILVMYKGAAVEYGSTGQLLADPRMPYTKALLTAIRQLRRAPT